MSKNKNNGKHFLKNYLGPSFLGIIFFLLYIPLFVLVIYSFNDTKFSPEWNGFSWQAYLTLWQKKELLLAAQRSLTVAFLSATASTLVGSLMAFSFYRFAYKLKKATQNFFILILLAPDIILGICFLLLFGLIHLKLGFTSLLIAHCSFCLPYTVITITARLSGLNKHIIEAAIDLGASESMAYRKIFFPLMMPAIISGWLLAFTLSLDDVVISFFTSGPDYEILPIKIHSLVRLGLRPEVNALSVPLLFFSFIVAFFVKKFSQKESL